MVSKRIFAGLACLATMFAGAGQALAQWKPQGRVTVLVGYQAGGGADTLTRLLVEAIASSRGWQIVVENRTGAGGGLMMTQLARSAPDGLTVGVAATGTITVTPLFNKSLKYSVNDFTYLGTIARAQMAMIARRDAPYNTLEEFAEFARKKGHASVAVMGPEIGLIAKLMAKHYKIDLTILPTKGGAETLTETISGQIDAAFNAGAHHPFVQDGKLKVIANLNDAPLVLTPKALSIKQSGIDYATNVFFQIQGPANMPAEIAKAWAEAIDQAVKSERLVNMAGKKMLMEVNNLGPDRLRDLVLRDLESSRKLIEATK
jgi:tripartite-type tricarboxylate transporter receptor subunit TctC